MGHISKRRFFIVKKTCSEILPMFKWQLFKSIEQNRIIFHALLWTPRNHIVWCLPLSLMNVTIIKFLFWTKLICYWHFIITWHQRAPSFLHPPPPGSRSKNLSVSHLLQRIIHQLSPDTQFNSRNMIYTNCHHQRCWCQDYKRAA